MACYNPVDLSPDELSCPICFEDFTVHSSSERNPKLLMCLHTFCLGCIRNLVKSNKSLQCSICRAEHKDVSPVELFDNHVIVDYIKKQQEESDAQLARQHSLADASAFTYSSGGSHADYQRREDQVASDAEYARKIQSLYDEQPNAQPEALVSETVCMSYPAPPVCRGIVKQKAVPPVPPITVASFAVPPVPAYTGATFKCPHVTVAPAVVTATTSQTTTVVVYGQSSGLPERPLSRSVTPDTSASSSTTPSSSTTSSSGTTTSSDTTSSDDRCSSRASASSRLDDEFVDSVDIRDAANDRIASEVAGTAEVNVSGSTGISALTATHTNNSGFSSTDGWMEEVDADVDNDDDDDDDDGDDDGLVSEGFLSELEEDGGEDTACSVVELLDESDVVSNMDVLETLDESAVDDESNECIDVDESVQQAEDELFDNFNVLESSNIDHAEDGDAGPTPMSSRSGSSESEDSCADVAPVVDTGVQVSLDSVLAGVNDPDDDTNSTITLNDTTVESESDNVVLLNVYNGVLTRSATSKLRKSNPNLSL